MMERIEHCHNSYNHPVGSKCGICDEIKLASLRARLEEALWWMARNTSGHSRSCSYDLHDPSPEADFCSCGLNRRQSEQIQKIEQLQNEIIELEALVE